MDWSIVADFVLDPGTWRLAVEVCILWFLIYTLLRLISGTRAAQVLMVIVAVGLLALVARAVKLPTLNWIFENASSEIFVIIAVLFAYELRRALAGLGFRSGFFWQNIMGHQYDVVHEVVEAASMLAKRRWGAIVVLQRDADLEGYIETGVELDAKVSAKLLGAIFAPNSPLHDRAVIIDGQRVAAASCLLPLSEREEVDSELGTRHRAALGITEETDAVAVVVSEERGTISLAIRGNLTLALDGPALERTLQNILAGAGGR